MFGGKKPDNPRIYPLNRPSILNAIGRPSRWEWLSLSAVLNIPMRPYPAIRQHPSQIVSLDGWMPDDDFPFGLSGAKAKRIFVCPPHPPQPFLIGGHRYLFKEPEGPRIQQIWSEVIAYEVSRHLDVKVPPAFLARAPGNGSPGVLIEFFYGYDEEPGVRLIHAIDRLQALKQKTDYKIGSLKDNVLLCRSHRISSWKEWWAKTLAFDAIIGNTDRHTENWGFISEIMNGVNEYRMAPAFDNGTSLGFVVRDSDIEDILKKDRFEAFLRRGRHHYGWVHGDRDGAQHIKLCQTYCSRYIDTGGVSHINNLRDTVINEIVYWCTQFDYDVQFTPTRAKFVAAQLKQRRDGLAQACGV